MFERRFKEEDKKKQIADSLNNNILDDFMSKCLTPSKSNGANSAISSHAIKLELDNVDARKGFTELIQEGSRLSIFFIISETCSQPFNVRDPVFDFLKKKGNIILCNDLDPFTAFNDSGMTKQALLSINKRGWNDTLAVSHIGISTHKFRPIIYNNEDFDILKDLIKGE